MYKGMPYTPGEQKNTDHWIKLNTNENPYPPSPQVIKALHQAIDDNNLHLYPQPESDQLQRCIAQYYQLSPESVFVGNGSDEVLAHSFQAFFRQSDPILFPEMTYNFYKSYCALYNIDYRMVPLENYQINIDRFLQRNGGIIFPNPNAPTGCLIPLKDIECLLNHNTESVVIIDEAYIDFGGESVAPFVKQYPNLLVTQTFSKSRSLAGLRIGFALGQPVLIDALTRVKNSFNAYPLDRLASIAAIAALNDQKYFEKTRQQIIKSREWLSKELSMIGFQVVPSAANFLFVRHPDAESQQLLDRLKQQHCLVRLVTTDSRSYLRISIGTQKQCNALIQYLKACLLQERSVALASEQKLLS